MNIVFAIFCTTISAGFAATIKEHHKLPEGFLQCRRNDPKFNSCLATAANLAIPPLVKGVPKYQLPTIDPLRISRLVVDQGSGPVNIKLNFTDLDVHGLSEAKIQEADMDFDKLKLTMKVTFSNNIVLNGYYSINGKVLVLPITGNGRSKIILAGFKAQVKVLFDKNVKNGEEYYNIRHLDFNFSTKKLHINLQNLFNGDKALGDNMNVFLNENWVDILEELRPAFSAAFSAAFTQISQRFFNKVPISLVFPET